MKLFKKLGKKIFIGMIALIVIGGPLIYLTLLNSKSVSASWYDDNWAYRQIVAITNSTSAQTDYQVQITLDTQTLATNGKIQTSCNDLRVTDIGGKLLPFWIEPTTCNTTATKIWVKVPNIPSTGGSVYLYYGNPSASSGQVSSTSQIFIREVPNVQGSWNMDESTWANDCTASPILDSSGNGLNGKSCPNGTGATGNATGKFNKGGLFDSASSQYFSIADNNTLDFTTAMTISFWYKRSASGVQTAAGKWLNTGNQQSYVLQVHTDNKIYWNVSGTGSDAIYFTSTSTYTDTNWNHLVGVYNGTTLTVYLNGSTVAGSITGTVPSSLYNSTTPLENRYNGSNYYSGTIDDLKVYNRALTQAEITDIYNNEGYTTSNYANKELVRKFSSNVSIASPASEEKSPGPIAYWKFNEGQGTSANDSTSNKNTGTLSGATKPTWQSEDQCVSGKCLYFDGSSSYIDAGDPSNGSLDFGIGDFSASVWVNPTANGKVVFSKGANAGNAAGSKSGYMIYIDTDYTVWGEIASIDDNTLYYYFKTTNAISASTWTHIAMVRTSSSVKVYFNGVLQAGSNNGTGTASQITTVSTNASFRIGSYTPLGYYFQGKIDDIKVYPYARTAAQIASDYNSRGSVKGAAVNLGVAAPLDGAAAQVYLKMEEGSGTSANDTSGNARTGTLNGGSTWTSGKYGKGVKVDGVSGSNVSVPDFSY